MLDQREMLVATSAILALAMVLGALFLLYRGNITLEPAAGGGRGSTTITLKNFFTLKTNIAAIALFAFGAVFLVIGFSNVDQPLKFRISGRVMDLAQNDTLIVRVCGGPWIVNAESDGSISQSVKPDLDQFQVQITKVGTSTLLTKSIRHGKGKDPGYGSVLIDENGVAQLGPMTLNAVVPPGTPTAAATPRPQPAETPPAPPPGPPKY